MGLSLKNPKFAHLKQDLVKFTEKSKKESKTKHSEMKR